MSQEPGNGVYKELTVIRSDIGDLKDSIEHLVNSIHILAEGVQDFKKFTERFFEKSVPLKIVVYMFGILLVSHAGVEGVRWLFKSGIVP